MLVFAIVLGGFFSFLFILLLWIITPLISFNNAKRSRISNKDNLLVASSKINKISREIDEAATIEGAPTIEISLVCPAYNEESRLPEMLDNTLPYLNKWCNDQKITYEMIIVDDGSTDNTIQVVYDYMTKNNVLKLLKLERNCGKGGAIRRGIQRCKGSYILMLDADGATDICALDKLYSSLKRVERGSEVLKGSVGAAIGSRAHLESTSIAKRSLLRTILMMGLHLLVMLFCTRKIRDTQCGFKLFTRSTARFIFSLLHLERWSFDIELIYLLDVLDIPMIEVSVKWNEIPGSKLIQSSYDVIFVSLNMLRDMICVWLAYSLGFWRYNDL